MFSIKKDIDAERQKVRAEDHERYLWLSAFMIEYQGVIWKKWREEKRETQVIAWPFVFHFRKMCPEDNRRGYVAIWRASAKHRPRFWFGGMQSLYSLHAVCFTEKPGIRWAPTGAIRWCGGIDCHIQRNCTFRWFYKKGQVPFIQSKNNLSVVESDRLDATIARDRVPRAGGKFAG